MYLDPNVVQFINSHKEEIKSEDFQSLFFDWGKYTQEHAAEAWVLEESQDLLILLNNIDISTDYILSKMTEIPQYMLFFYDKLKLVIPDNITHIHQVGLGGNETIEKLYIPKSVIHIGNNGIACENLIYLEIPGKFGDQLENLTGLLSDELEEIDINYF